MKAIVVHEFGGPDVLKYEEVPDPTPGPGEVVIVVKAAGINPVDAYVRTGTYAANKPALPYTPGTDAAGIVEAIGKGVTGFAPGDRVYTTHQAKSVHAEKAAVPVSAVRHLPDNVSFAQGASLGVPYATAYRALVGRGKAMAGETLLVHGATGSVGLASVQIARALGLTVFGTAGSDEGAAVAKREGAHQVFNRREDGYLDKAKAATPGGKGFDIILEMLANVNLGKDLPVLANDGRVVVVGNRGTVEINPRDLMPKNADIRAMSLPFLTPEEIVGIHAALIAGMENGSLRPIIAKEIALSDAIEAHKEVMAEGGHAPGKIVLVP